MKPKKEPVINFEDQKATVDIVADSIVEISRGIKELRKSKLTDRGLIILIQHSCKNSLGSGYQKRRPTATEIEAVLDGLESLERTFVK